MKKLLLAIAFAAAASLGAFAELSVNGYAESRFFWIMDKQNGSFSQANINHARINMLGTAGEHLQARVAFDGYYLAGAATSMLSSYTTSAASALLGNGVSYLSLDRAYVTFFNDTYTVDIGKQRVAWGFGQLFKPLDLFNIASVSEPKAEKPGVNAARFSYFLGATSFLEAAYFPGSDGPDSDGALRAEWKMGPLQASACYVYLHKEGVSYTYNSYTLNAVSGDRNVIGAELHGDTVIGWWSSLAASQYHNEHWDWELTLGADYTFYIGEKLYVAAEYYHHQDGNADADSYTFSDDFLPVYLSARPLPYIGRDYLYMRASYPINMFMTVAIAGLCNVCDRSYLLYPMFSWTPWQWANIDIGVMYYDGESGTEFHPSSQEDPFNALGNSKIFSWFKVNF